MRLADAQDMAAIDAGEGGMRDQMLANIIVRNRREQH